MTEKKRIPASNGHQPILKAPGFGEATAGHQPVTTSEQKPLTFKPPPKKF